MVNENPSREDPPRQQSSERAQPGSTTLQQGAGTGSQRGAPQVGSGNYSPGGSAPASQAEAYSGAGQRTQGTGSTGQASAERGTSKWQGGRSGRSGGGLQRQGFSPLSPYAEDYEPGYGGGPFSIMRRISDVMDRFFENFGMGRSVFPGADQGFGQRGTGAQNVPSMWSPHIEVCERNGKLLIQADLPGIKRDDINVRIESDAVILQGERNQEQTTNQSGYFRSERSYGSFYRSIPLPEGTNTESASASFRDGVLEIELDAPREPQRGRTLEIREAGAVDAPGRSAGNPGSTDATRSSQGS